jgi:hypothetical protein
MGFLTANEACRAGISTETLTDATTLEPVWWQHHNPSPPRVSSSRRQGGAGALGRRELGDPGTEMFRKMGEEGGPYSGHAS